MPTQQSTHVRRRTLTHRAVRLASGVALAAALACGGGDATGPAPIVGTYTLQSIGGNPLPVALVNNASEKDEVTSATITMRSGGTFSFAVTVRQTAAGVQVQTTTSKTDGTWIQSGANVTMSTTATGSTFATLSGNTLMVPGEDGTGGIVPWVFRK